MHGEALRRQLEHAKLTGARDPLLAELGARAAEERAAIEDIAAENPLRP
jgi:hypothetical protein